ncbi:MAG: hypothetical protein EZS28_051004, partial [Streblomastix strix]
TFDSCFSTSGSGGGLYMQVLSGSQFTISGTSSLLNCNSENIGGGIYCWISNQGQISLNNTKFRNCSSQRSGGGIYVSINEGGQLILDKSCEFYQCQSGNGGGIYVMNDHATQCSFMIKDAYIHECRALNSTNSSLSYPESGFGGGIFLGCNGNYNPSSKLIDLHGMRIYNNKADKFGQSLYVAMPKVVEWCKYGILGEYVKGNYSDTYSDERDLVGIPLNLTSFESSTQEQIEQQSQLLEPLWRILGILKSAQVIVNVSNSNGKLIFRLEGQKMIPGYLNVKIFELRNKTKEEIDQ